LAKGYWRDPELTAERFSADLDFNKLFYLTINSHQLHSLAPAAIEQRKPHPT